MLSAKVSVRVLAKSLMMLGLVRASSTAHTLEGQKQIHETLECITNLTSTREKTPGLYQNNKV